MTTPKQLNKVVGKTFGALLVEEVRARLCDARGDWGTLVTMSGGTITRPWLSAVAQGKIEHPNFPLVCELAMYLGLRVGVSECRHFSEAKLTYKP